jgi:release factor glutamine methyltransferase
VLIPRPETELLVELALERLGEIPSEHPCVLDLGTGSGAIAIAIASVLAANRPGATVSACDASEAALAVARANAARHGVPVRLLCSDWFAALGDERFDVVVANPPYIAGQDPHLEQGDLRFEPRSALVADEGGLGCLRAIAETARAHLQTGGWLLMEHGYDQGEPCVQLLERLGYAQVSDRRDLSGNPRVVQGRFDPAAARR